MPKRQPDEKGSSLGTRFCLLVVWCRTQQLVLGIPKRNPWRLKIMPGTSGLQVGSQLSSILNSESIRTSPKKASSPSVIALIRSSRQEILVLAGILQIQGPAPALNQCQGRPVPKEKLSLTRGRVVMEKGAPRNPRLQGFHSTLRSFLAPQATTAGLSPQRAGNKAESPHG